MKHRTRSDKTYTIPKGIAVGTSITIGTLLAGISILAYFIVNGKLEPDMIQYISLAILALSVYAGVFLSSRMIMKQYAIVGLIQSAIMIVILIGAHIFFFEGAFEGTTGTIAVICAGAAGACMSVMAPKRTGRKKRNR